MLNNIYAVDRSGLPSSTLRFDRDDSTQRKKPDEMDLDNILSRAEDHETMVSPG